MSIARFAHVAAGVVVNISDGLADWTPPEGVVLATGAVAIGDTYADGSFTPPAAPALTAAQRQAALVAAVQAHLDATARSHGYDSIYTACTYADEPAVPRFQAEGQAFRAWRSLVWAHCYQVLDDVQSGRRAIPSAADLIAELPTLHIAYPADPPPDA